MEISSVQKLRNLSRCKAVELYEQVLKDNDAQTLRWLCLNDLFFLLSVAMRREDANRDWIYARCREVEADPNDRLDLWSREHYKSTIITFAETIQDVLKDRDITIGIFSHTRPIAKAFLAQIKRELENNEFLKGLFPEVLWANPKKESPKWSLDDGIIVCRRSNPKESTIEAWGLVDGQPTSKHYRLMVFDDVVVRESVTTPEMIKKTTDAWALSLNLSTEGGAKRYIGTRYHTNDTYAVMIERGVVRERRHPATDNGEFDGTPVLWTKDQFDEKVRAMGSYVAAAQLLQNPLADSAMGFREEWMEHYDVLRGSKKWNYYIIVDPASEKKKDNDFTSMWVIGLAPDGNYYVVDGARDRINLTERCAALMKLHRLWRPLRVGYEKYGMQSDIEHIKYIQQQEGYRFRITEMKGSMPKNDRIRRLVPLFEQRRVYFPIHLHYVTVEGRAIDLVAEFKRDEFLTFPVGKHDDMLDCLSRICDPDLNATFPTETDTIPLSLNLQQEQERYDPLRIGGNRQRSTKQIQHPTMSWRELMTINNN